MRLRLKHSAVPVSQLLRSVARGLPAEKVSLSELLDSLGREGLLIFCILLALPFALPISIPGTSLPFGAVIALIGVGAALDQIPWLPDWLMRRRFSSERVSRILVRSALLSRKLEKFVRPRLRGLVDPHLAHRWNGVMISIAGLLLMAPIPIPGTNSPPAWAVMLLCFGISQRDGGFVLAGYIANLFSFLLIAGLIVTTVLAGRGIIHLFNGV